MANHARATEIALGSKMQIAAGANTSAETGGDLVIAQINVRAAARAIR